jgi:hypothetical protein
MSARKTAALSGACFARTCKCRGPTGQSRGRQSPERADTERLLGYTLRSMNRACRFPTESRMRANNGAEVSRPTLAESQTHRRRTCLPVSSEPNSLDMVPRTTFAADDSKARRQWAGTRNVQRCGGSRRFMQSGAEVLRHEKCSSEVCVLHV